MLSISTIVAGLFAAVVFAAAAIIDRLWRRLQILRTEAEAAKSEASSLQRKLVKQKSEFVTVTQELALARRSLLARAASAATPAAEPEDDFERTLVLRPDITV